MPKSPKQDTPLPRVTIIRRGSVQVARRFFLGRRGLRRSFILFIFLCIIYYIGIRKRPGEYDLGFIEDDEDIVQSLDHARRAHITARKALANAKAHKFESRPPMTRSRDGLIRVGGHKGPHPLFDVILAAERDWKAEVDSRPSTLLEAHDAYVIANGRPPAASYPDFFNFLPTQCPMPSIESLYLYKPLSSSMMHRHQAGLEGAPMTITIIVHNGRTGGGAADSDDRLFYLRDISRHIMNLMVEIGEFLPELRFTLSVDYPRNPLPYKLKSDMEDLNQLGERLEESDREEDGDVNGVYTFHDWTKACGPDEPIHGAEIEPNPDNTLSFIYTPRPLSPCQHPSLMHLSDYFAGSSPDFGVLHPVFAFSRTALNGDILIPRPDSTQGISSKIPWGKKQPVLYWRGPATLGSSADELIVPANRLMAFFNSTREQTVPQHILIPRNSDSFEVQAGNPLTYLRTRIDLAFTQCHDKVGCRDMSARYPFSGSEHAYWDQNKYILDLESYGGQTATFRQLLLTGSLVLRSSLAEDFWVAQARPWVHYVPVQPDFSDLPTILLFFEAHDHLAKRIALAGQTLARECFGRAGTKAGLMLVLGEYGRMWSNERVGADMVLV